MNSILGYVKYNIAIDKPSRTKPDGYKFATWFGIAILAGLALAHIAGRMGWL